MIPLMLDEIIEVIQGRPARALSPMRVTGVSTDSRSCAADDLFFALRGERFDGREFVDQALEAGAAAAVIEGAPAPDERAIVYVNNVVEALGRLAAFHRAERSATVIAVTGSNGKTTTKSMIHHVLSRRLRGRASEKSFNNSIGVPLTLLSAGSGDEYLVVEIGSNARGEIAPLSRLASPNIAVITSIGDAHLQGLCDREGVVMEKRSLLDHLRPGGLAVLNADVPELVPTGRRDVPYTTVTFGTSDEADVRVTDIDTRIDATTFKINGKFGVTLRSPGRHNAMNAAAAFAVCRRMNIEPEAIVEALSECQPPPMRLNVSKAGSITVIDDSYNANPTSTAAALDVLQSVKTGRRVMVAGEMLELGEASSSLHERTGRQIAEAGVDLLVAIGAHAPDTITGAHAVRDRLSAIMYLDTDAACRDLPNWLSGTDTVLIKGSRQLQLDRVAKCVREAFA